MLFQKSPVKGVSSQHITRGYTFDNGENPFLAARVQQNDQERANVWTNTRRVDDAPRAE
jgi:hypothetical protein